MKVPEYANPSQADLEFEAEIKALPDTVAACIEDMEFRDGLVEIERVTKLANKYFNDQEPWKAVKEDKQKAANCLYLSNQMCKALAVLLKPYIPRSADKICEILNIPQDNSWDDAKVFLETGHEINKAKPLFKKIEDEVIEAQKEKLYKNLESQEKEVEEVDHMDLITIDEFAKVEIRIGQIKECEKIKKSNKLLKTQIDIGDKTIQVIAGLGKRYAPEDLIGKKVPVVVNLQPAKLMGEESQGMIMATESAAILTPDDCEIGELLM
jgi:methionyl-tRNA synthetase